MNTDKLPKISFLLGLSLLFISYFIPYDSMEFILGEGLRPFGLVSIFINPILGIIGVVSSFIRKNWLYLGLNTLLIFSFFISMYLSYLLN